MHSEINTLINRTLECLSPKQAQLIPSTVVLYDKECTIQRAGCQLPGDR